MVPVSFIGDRAYVGFVVRFGLLRLVEGWKVSVDGGGGFERFLPRVALLPRGMLLVPF